MAIRRSDGESIDPSGERKLAGYGDLKLPISMQERASHRVCKRKIQSIIEDAVVPKCHPIPGDNELATANPGNVERQQVGDSSFTILCCQALRSDGRMDRVRYLKDQVLPREQSDRAIAKGSKNSSRLFDEIFVLKKPLDSNRRIDDIRWRR